MIWWSVVADEIILSPLSPASPYAEIEFNGMTCLVEKISPTQCRLIRIITTSPQAYLEPVMQPGTLLNYSPELADIP